MQHSTLHQTPFHRLSWLSKLISDPPKDFTKDFKEGAVLLTGVSLLGASYQANALADPSSVPQSVSLVLSVSSDPPALDSELYLCPLFARPGQ